MTAYDKIKTKLERLDRELAGYNETYNKHHDRIWTEIRRLRRKKEILAVQREKTSLAQYIGVPYEEKYYFVFPFRQSHKVTSRLRGLRIKKSTGDVSFYNHVTPWDEEDKNEISMEEFVSRLSKALSQIFESAGWPPVEVRIRPKGYTQMAVPDAEEVE